MCNVNNDHKAYTNQKFMNKLLEACKHKTKCWQLKAVHLLRLRLVCLWVNHHEGELAEPRTLVTSCTFE